jgi:hypothetical protein
VKNEENKATHAAETAAAPAGRRAFIPPCLTRHEPLVNITLLSNGDWDGGGDSGGTFFG